MLKTANKIYDAIIIGAGASGLFCALNAAKLGQKIAIIDHANKAGKKILMSGGGRCNFANYISDSDYYICQNPHFVKSALAQYSNFDFIRFVERHKLPYVIKNDTQLFCQNHARDLLNLLLDECQRHGVALFLDTSIAKVQYKQNLHAQSTDKNGAFVLHTIHKSGQKTMYYSKNLVVATGGLSIASMGATGFGYDIAAQFGHDCVNTTAALVPFVFSDGHLPIFKNLAGVSTKARVFNEHISFVDNILFTHKGLSGPAILQFSSHYKLGDVFYIDFFVDFDVAKFLHAQKQQNPNKILKNVLLDMAMLINMPKKLALTLADLVFGAQKLQSIGQIKDHALLQYANHLHAYALKPATTEGYRTAEVTKGGVCTKQIDSKTMQSRLQDGLYFIGEVLDVTGFLGGYNFMWAWSSAYVCAKNLGKSISHTKCHIS